MRVTRFDIAWPLCYGYNIMTLFILLSVGAIAI